MFAKVKTAEAVSSTWNAPVRGPGIKGPKGTTKGKGKRTFCRLVIILSGRPRGQGRRK